MYYIVIIQILNVIILNVMISTMISSDSQSTDFELNDSDSSSSESKSTENDSKWNYWFCFLFIDFYSIDWIDFTRIDLDLPMVTWTYCTEMEIVMISYSLSKKKESSVFVIFSLSSEDGFDLWGLLKQPRAVAAS